MNNIDNADVWLALVIGNTRLHWAAFDGNALQGTWHTRHLTLSEAIALTTQKFVPDSWKNLELETSPLEQVAPHDLMALDSLPLYVASVVPSQTILWQGYSERHTVSLAQIPLGNLYPTLGIDRALNLLGAGDRYGWPVLVIDAGTALTFTAGAAGQLMGGAILPGLALQFNSLEAQTANLPLTEAGATLPSRWARETPDAIRSGVVYATIATVQDFIQDWFRQYPEARVVFTGGDSLQLWQWLSVQRDRVGRWYQNENLMFYGLCRYRQRRGVQNISTSR